MQEAREVGATWEAIGDALGITKQGAQDYYRRQIEKQENFVPDILDATRARAALSEGRRPISVVPDRPISADLETATPVNCNFVLTGGCRLLWPGSNGLTGGCK